MDQHHQPRSNNCDEFSRRVSRHENVSWRQHVLPAPMVPKVLKYHAECVADRLIDEISGLWKCIRSTRPKGIRGWLQLGALNVFTTLVVFAVGVITFESSISELRNSLGTTVLFPIYLPHAAAMAITTRSRKPVFLGNFIAFYVIRVYAAWRGGYLISVSRGSVLFAAAVVGAAEISAGACGLRRFLCKRTGRKHPSIESVSEALTYIVTVFLCSLIFGTVSSVVIVSSPIVQWRDFYRYFGSWCMSVLAGYLTTTPVLLQMFMWKPRAALFRPRKVCEALGMGGITTALVIIIFLTNLQTVIHPLPYLLFPIIILSAFMFNRVGCGIVVFIMAYVCSWASIRRKGAVYRMSGSPSVTSPKLILQVELFVSVLGAVGLMLAAAVREKKNLARDLRIMNEELENTVSQRTQELVMANEELKESQRKAEEASQAKSDFLANMSHEIRTPIHGIMGLTALLLDSELSVDQRDSLSSVKECANLLLHIINSILDLAKIEAGRVEVELFPFNVRQLVSSTIRMLATRAQDRHLELLWEVDSAVPEWMVGDSGKIQQCLLNLVGNAVKFTHEGSVKVQVAIDVNYSASERGSSWHTFELDNQFKTLSSSLNSSASSVHDQSLDSTTINIHDKPVEWQYCPKEKNGFYAWKLQNGAVYGQESVFCAPILFEVRDTGIGISSEKLLDIFRPFVQADASTSRVYGGTGLGLCIVQRFVELLGGKLVAESEVNKGSAFRFSIPLGFSEAQTTDANSVDFIDSLDSLGFSQPLDNVISPIPDKGSEEKDIASIPEKGGKEKDVPFPIPDKGGGVKDVPSPIADKRGEEEDVPSSIADKGVEVKKTTDVASSNLMTKQDPVNVNGQGDSKGYPLPMLPPCQSYTVLHLSFLMDAIADQVFWMRVSKKIQEEMRWSLTQCVKPENFKSCNCDHISRTYQMIIEGPSQLPWPEYYSFTKKNHIGNLRRPLYCHVKSKGIEGKAWLQDTREFGHVDQKLSSIESKLERCFLTDDGWNKTLLLHVLLAEDNIINQKVAVRQLQKHGHKVTVVGDGVGALDAVKANHDLYDLVIMDVQMPNMDGLEATRMIREEEVQRGWRRVPILGLTAHAIQGYELTCLSCGMDGYLGKPFDINQLLRAMSKYLPVLER